jgi:hypothetical protein
MSLVANYTNCHNKLNSLPASLSQVELANAVSAAAQAINDNKLLLNGKDNLNAVAAALANSANNFVQNNNGLSSNNSSSGGKKRVQCAVCLKTFCDK